MKYRSGKITVSILGAYCEEYLNRVFSEGIVLRDITNEKGLIKANAQRRDYKKLALLSREYGVRVRVTGRSGLYFRLAWLKKRPGLIAGALFSCAVVLILRQFIWHIDIHGNNTLSDGYMLSRLEEYGITAGIEAGKADTLTAERLILRENENISWINIEINGSRADVYINESKPDEQEEIGYRTPCNIVSDRDAVIVSCDVRSGAKLLREGNTVRKGSLIVSGTVESGGSLVLVHSDADIIGEFDEDISFEMNYVTVEKVPQGEPVIRRQLMLLGFVFPLDGEPENTADMICREEIQSFYLFSNEMPWRIKTETYTPYSEITVTRRDTDVRAALDRQLEQYIRNFFSDYELVSQEKEYTATDEGLRLRVKLRLRGNIGRKQVIYDR